MEQNIEDIINMQALPEHVAIIMDGNRRWAKKNNLEIIYGIDMLINQALEAFYIWTGINPCNEDFEHIKKLYENSI